MSEYNIMSNKEYNVYSVYWVHCVCPQKYGELKGDKR